MPTRDLFLARVAVWNLAALGFFLYVAAQGYLELVLRYDPTISAVLLTLHVYFSAVFFRRAWRVQRLVEAARANAIAEDRLAWEIRKNTERSRYFMTLANVTVAITLVGNAWGFVQTFVGFDPQSLADPARLSQNLAAVLAGPAMALLATVTGVCFYIVQIVNARMLYTALATVERR